MLGEHDDSRLFVAAQLIAIERKADDPWMVRLCLEWSINPLLLAR
jgi:hypothetical protein